MHLSALAQLVPACLPACLPACMLAERMFHSPCHVQEPTKHQYDWDAATTVSFLRKYKLIDDFKLNIECNHATLSGMQQLARRACFGRMCL